MRKMLQHLLITCFVAMLTQVEEVRWRRDEGRLEGCHGVSLARLAVWLVNCTLSIVSMISYRKMTAPTWSCHAFACFGLSLLQD